MSSFRRSDELPRGTSRDSRRRAPTTKATKPAAVEPEEPFVPEEKGWTLERNPKRPSVQLYRHDGMRVVTQDNIYAKATRNHIVAVCDHARIMVKVCGYESYAEEGIAIVHNGLPRAIYKKNESILAFELVERTRWDRDDLGEDYAYTRIELGNTITILSIDKLNDVL